MMMGWTIYPLPTKESSKGDVRTRSSSTEARYCNNIKINGAFSSKNTPCPWGRCCRNKIGKGDLLSAHGIPARCCGHQMMLLHVLFLVLLCGASIPRI